MNGRGRVKVAMPPARHYEATIREYLPRAEIVRISSPRDFLRKQTDGADALAISAEAGSALEDETACRPSSDPLAIRYAPAAAATGIM